MDNTVTCGDGATAPRPTGRLQVIWRGKRARRFIRGLCLAALVLLAPPVVAGPDASMDRGRDTSLTSTIEKPLRMPDYRLAAGDRVSIKIYGREDVSGEFSVRPDGSLVVPLLGSFHTDQKTPAALEREIEAALARIDPKKTFLSLEVIEWRPIHILGAIEKPGVYMFRAGMTVMHAVAVAGGFYRPFATAELSLQGMREIGEMQRTKEQLALALGTEARLNAEIEGADKIQLPQRIVQLVGTSSAEQIISAENALLIDRKVRHQKQLDSLDDQISLTADEVAAVEAQLSSAADRAKSSSTESEEIDAVAKRGLANRLRALSLRTEAAAHETEQLAIAAALVRAKRDYASAKQSRSVQEIEYNIRLREELKAVRANVRQLEIALASSSAILHGGAGLRKPGMNPSVSFTIIRLVEGQPERLSVSQEFFLEPGDLIHVNIATVPDYPNMQMEIPLFNP